MAVASVPEYGGYDYKFMEEASEKFVCNICTKVLRDPHLTVCCGQHFCQSCLEYWFKKHGKKSCPHCREEDFNHFLNKAQKREIGELKIHCTLHQEGCQWVGELDSLQTHLNSDSGCGYVEVSCTNKCGKQVKRKDLKQHQTEECPLRNYKCKYCGREYTYQVITGDTGGSEYPSRRNHYDECPYYPLDCPNRCGGTAIPRKDMSDHRAKCPLEPVECPFKKAGCKARLVRMNYIKHMTSNTQQHLLLTVQKLQKKCGEYEQRLAAAEELQLQFQIAKAGASYYMRPLLEGCTEEQKAPLLHIQALLDDPKQLYLKSIGDLLTITMTEFSHYKQSGKVWHSPPFYYSKGYKMGLAVYANGTGAGAGTHVSVSLLLLRGEFDDQLNWPMGMAGKGILIQLLGQKQMGQREPSTEISLFPECSPWPTASCQPVPDGEGSRVVGGEEKFADHETVQQYNLLHNSILLRLTCTTKRIIS